MSTTLKEAERLHKLGLAILWIKPKSKAPIESNWTTGARKPWTTLKAQYRLGMNVGVRLGTPSKIRDKYLAVIDIDVKSTDPAHRAEAEAAVQDLFPGLPPDAVKVMSGRGNGSSHIYVLTPSPAAPSKRRVSSTKVKALMPSAPVSAIQREQLSAEDLEEGYRMRPAWEIAVMGEGQQVLLPPSLHPDSGREYIWVRRLESVSVLAEMDLGRKSKDQARDKTNDWEPEDVDLVSSPLPDDIVELIFHAGSEDRSASLFRVCIAMIKAEYTDRQIMSVLTDTSYELGRVAYEHAKTTSRERAANWVFNYTIKKSKKAAGDHDAFERDVEVTELSDDAAVAQSVELSTPVDWRQQLDKTKAQGDDPGHVKNTLKNIVLILTNEVSPDVFRYNEFTINYEVAYDTPWGSRAGAEFADHDVQLIKLWVAKRFRFQPSDDNVWSALINIGHANKYHPVVKYLRSLPEWDGKPRIDRFFKDYMNGEAPKEYLSAISRKTICAMVARVLQPGIKFDYMPILEGKQGLRKSTAIRVLAGDAWFTDANLELNSKDAVSDLHGKWVVEQGEMSVMDTHDVKVLKQFISRTTDRMRPPYGRKSQDYPRQCVLIGSTNDEEYLKDVSGNRRYWPFRVTGDCNVDAIIRDRDQIFAEALFAFESLDEPLYLEEKHIERMAVLEQENRVSRDELMEVISAWISDLEKQPKNRRLFDPEKFTINDILSVHGPVMDGPIVMGVKGDKAGQRRVGDCLRRLGYTPKTVRENDTTCRKWIKNTFVMDAGEVLN